MKRSQEYIEAVTKAKHDIGFLLDHLDVASKKAPIVERQAIFPIEEEARKLQDRIERLNAAIEADEKGAAEG